MPKLDRARTTGHAFNLSINADGTWPHEVIQCALLMDIRDELQKLNSLLHCSNFTGIPTTLRSIRRAMPVRRPRKKV